MDAPNQSNEQIQDQPQSIFAKTMGLMPLLKDLGPSFIALVIGSFYVSGFLILNSNLAKFGINDIEFINAHYFLASAGFAFFLVCFYLFAGRAVINAPKWLGEDIRRINKDGESAFWSSIVLVIRAKRNQNRFSGTA